MPSLAELVTSNAAKDDIKDVPALPGGTYLALIVGNHEMIKAQTGTDGIQFMFRLVSASDDVDASELEAHLSARDCSLHDITMKHTIYDSAYAGTALRDFVYDALSINESMPLKQALAEVPGRNFNVHFRHKPFKAPNDEMKMRAEIDKTFAAD
jgi:hypothetical protein